MRITSARCTCACEGSSSVGYRVLLTSSPLSPRHVVGAVHRDGPVSNKRWPPAHQDVPLGYGVELTFGNPADMLPALQRVRAGAGLPVCARGANAPGVQVVGAHPGRWVSLHDTEETIFRVSGRLSKTMVAGGPSAKYGRKGLQLVPWVEINDYMWVPFACWLPPVNYQTARKCLASKTVTFTGESHARALSNAFISALVPPDASTAKYILKGSATDLNGACFSVDSVGVCATVVRNGRYFPGLHGSGGMVNVFNYGQSPIAEFQSLSA